MELGPFLGIVVGSFIGGWLNERRQAKRRASAATQARRLIDGARSLPGPPPNEEGD